MKISEVERRAEPEQGLPHGSLGVFVLSCGAWEVNFPSKAACLMMVWV